MPDVTWDDATRVHNDAMDAWNAAREERAKLAVMRMSCVRFGVPLSPAECAEWDAAEERVRATYAALDAAWLPLVALIERRLSEPHVMRDPTPANHKQARIY